jgi:hypothetical protein
MTQPEDKRTVAELQTELRARGLPVSGTRDELLERLAAADAARTAAPAEVDTDNAEAKAERTPAEEAQAERDAAIREHVDRAALVADDEGNIDPEAVVAYAGDCRSLVQEIRDRLDVEVVGVLEDFEARTLDPVAATVRDGSVRLRGFLGDVYRALAALDSACAELGTRAASL